MSNHVLFRVTFSLLLSMATGCTSWACSAPPSLQDQSRQLDTEGAIGKLLKLVGINISVKYRDEVKSTLREFPLADQTIVVLTTLHNICVTLDKDDSLPTERKIEIYRQIYENFLLTASGPKPVASTAAPRKRHVPTPEEQLGSNKRRSRFEGKTWYIPVANTQGDVDVVTADSKEFQWADIYLNPTPLVITEGNMYFVIVGSVLREEEGKDRISQLKKQFPQYDFELYAPCGSNKYYGIMIASWASRQRAQEALEVARKIDRTSYIWKCRNTGDTC